MILTEVRLPQLGRTCDCFLEEACCPEEIIREMAELLHVFCESGILLSVDKGHALMNGKTLEEQKVHSGETLLMFMKGCE